MKKKIIFEKIFEPVYRFDLLFIVGCDFDDLNKLIKKKHKLKPLPEWVRGSTGVTASITEEDQPKVVKGRIFIVWIRDKKDFYCLLHEVAHLVIKIFEDKNIAINDQTTEAYSYYQEFWFKKLWRLMNTK